MRLKNLIILTLILLMAFTGMATYAQSDEPIVVADVIPDILYVRSGPGSNFDIIGEVKVFTTVGVFGRNDAVTWVFVDNGTVSGWVNSAYLRFPEGFNVAGEVPIVAIDGVGASPVVATGGETTSQATTSTTTTTTTAATSGNGSTKVAANFRRGPGLQFSIITTLSANTSVAVIGRNGTGTWFKVQAIGQEGWIFGELLTINITRSDLPIVDGSTPATTTTTTTTSATPSAPTTTNTTTSTGRYDNVIVGVGPGGSKDRDGRLNPTTALGYAILYCVNADGYTDRGLIGGGIAVLHYAGPTPGVVFFATEAEIKAVGIPQDVALIKAEAGYYLYRRYDGLFELRAVNVNGTDSFAFRWLDCNPGPTS